MISLRMWCIVGVACFVVLRMTWRQEKAYRDGRFTPRYRPGTSEDVMLDGDGNGVEIFDVTDQRF
jgi:hypothetical protein